MNHVACRAEPPSNTKRLDRPSAIIYHGTKEDINMEDEDTGIEEGEVDDLKEDMARKSTTPTRTRTPKAKAKTTDDLPDLANKLRKMSLNKNGTDFSMSHSKIHFTYREGARILPSMRSLPSTRVCCIMYRRLREDTPLVSNSVFCCYCLFNMLISNLLDCTDWT